MGAHAATAPAVSPTTAVPGETRARVRDRARPANRCLWGGSATMGRMRETRSDAAARPEPSAADRERLARRYPGPRLPRPVLIGIVAVVAVGSMTWLIWTALVH